MKIFKKCLPPVITVVLLTLLDQFTKLLAVRYLKGQKPVVIWDGVFELNYLENRGAAFGIFQNQKVFFLITTSIIAVLLIWFYIKLPATKHYVLLRYTVLVCIAGAVGNFIDRMFNGYVVDFLYFKLIDFPIFNVADIYVTCSAIAFVVLYLFVFRDEHDFDFLSKKSSQEKNKEHRANESESDNDAK